MPKVKIASGGDSEVVRNVTQYSLVNSHYCSDNKNRGSTIELNLFHCNPAPKSVMLNAGFGSQGIHLLTQRCS
jgi:hypothetical protein